MTKRVRETARRIERARKELGLARQELAQVAADSPPAHTALSGVWASLQRVLDARIDRLNVTHGLVGYGLGYRVKDGAEHPEPCIVVFVRRKWSPAVLKRRGWKAAPRSLSLGKLRAPVDVIEVTGVSPHGLRASVGPISPIDSGTIGAIARDVDTNQRVLITAMHVMNLDEFPPPTGPHPFPVSVPSRRDAPPAPVIGFLAKGTTRYIDAAKVVITDWPRTQPFVPPVQFAGWRPPGNDVNAAVHAFGKESGPHDGVIKYVYVHIPEWKLVETVIVAGMATVRGDSGAALYDNQRLVLGFLFGLAPQRIGREFRVFCPTHIVMRFLRCTIDPS